MGDAESPTEVAESPEAFFCSLLDMVGQENLCHFTEEGLAEPADAADAAQPCSPAGPRRADRDGGMEGWMEGSLEDFNLVLQSIMSQADDLQHRLVNPSHSQVDGEAVVNTLHHFLKSCQPFFNKLEAVARSSAFSLTPLPSDVYKKLASVSQQLCERLKQLLLTCCSYQLVSLADSDPLGISHFAIGQSYIRGLRLTTFVYCQPAPYLAQVNTGLYKCMRWNVDLPGNQPAAGEVWDGQSEELDMEKVFLTDYYFLCYEDVPDPAETANKCSLDVGGERARRWSIGLWRPSEPRASVDDIIDWLLCPVPSASFKEMLLLDEEPTSWSATDLLLQLLQPLNGKETEEGQTSY